MIKTLSEDELRTKYPDLLKDVWFECSDGWFDILDALCGNIENHLESVRRKDPEDPLLQISISQIKEKFGGLRFYTSFTDDTISGMIRMAESMSYRVCEMCGNPGRSRKGGWIMTLCDSHAEEREKKMNSK